MVGFCMLLIIKSQNQVFIPSENNYKMMSTVFYLIMYRKVTNLQNVINNRLNDPQNEKEGFQYIDFLKEASKRHNTLTVHIM